MRKTIIALLLLLPTIPACQRMPASPPAATEAVPSVEYDRLLGLIESRLEVMHDVARRKWADKSPIEDPKREASLLRDVEERGKTLGLDGPATRAFFGAQIEAAKMVQRADLRRWEADPRGPAG